MTLDKGGRRSLLSGMARKLRLEYGGACYHVINRGREKGVMG